MSKQKRPVVEVLAFNAEAYWRVFVFFGSKADSRSATAQAVFNSARAANNSATAISKMLVNPDVRLWSK